MLSLTICRRKPALSLTGLGAIGVRSGCEARHQETIRDAGAIRTTIESVRPLVEIELPSGASAPVKRATNHGFRIADGGINSPEHLCGLKIVTEGDFVVRVVGFGCGGIGGRPIRAPDAQRFYPAV